MILYFDTETTGLYPGNICQLSYVMQEKEVTTAKNMYFTVDNVDFGAYQVHGLSVPVLYKLSEGKRFKDRIEEITQDFSRADLVVAHNSSFDFMFMRAEYERCGMEFTVKEELCSMKKHISICKIPKFRGYGYKYPKLEEMCLYYDIKNWQIEDKAEILFDNVNGFHDARFDTTALYMCMREGIKSEDSLKYLEDYL